MCSWRLWGNELVSCSLEWANWMVSRIFLADVGKKWVYLERIYGFFLPIER